MTSDRIWITVSAQTLAAIRSLATREFNSESRPSSRAGWFDIPLSSEVVERIRSHAFADETDDDTIQRVVLLFRGGAN